MPVWWRGPTWTTSGGGGHSRTEFKKNAHQCQKMTSCGASPTSPPHTVLGPLATGHHALSPMRSGPSVKHVVAFPAATEPRSSWGEIQSPAGKQHRLAASAAIGRSSSNAPGRLLRLLVGLTLTRSDLFLVLMTPRRRWGHAQPAVHGPHPRPFLSGYTRLDRGSGPRSRSLRPRGTLWARAVDRGLGRWRWPRLPHTPS